MQKKEASEEISLILADKKEPIIDRFFNFIFVFVGLDFFPCIQQLIREDADRNTFERVQIYTV